MTVYQKGSEKVENYREFRFLTTGQMGGLAREKTSRLSLERDKKTRREIANSNERRRMQSINSGFQQLKALLPDTEDDKRSKSVILHQAVDYITKLETEKLSLINQNARLMQLLDDVDGRLAKRKRGMECVDSELDLFQSGNMELLGKVERLARELRVQLDDERRRRLSCERQLDSIKAALRNSSASSFSTTTTTLPTTVVQSPSSSKTTKNSSTNVLQKSCETVESVLDQPEVVEDLKEYEDTSTSTVDTNKLVTCSMSRRNLETIVEAIRHLEGDPDNTLSSQQQQQSSLSSPQHQQVSLSGLQKNPQAVSRQLLHHSLSDEEHQLETLKLLQQQQSKPTPVLQIPKQIHIQSHHHPQLLSLVQSCQLSSPYGSPLSSPPLSSTPPQILQQPLSSPHHLISPIIICSPDSFLKSTSRLTAISTLDQS